MRIFRKAGSPREIAAGIALGCFIAVLPVLGLQIPLALGAAMLLRRLGLPISGISAAGGVWLNNPITMVPVYTATYFLGLPFARAMLSTPAHAATPREVPLSLSALGGEAILALTLGGVFLGLPLAFIGYRLALWGSRRLARAQASPGQESTETIVS